MVIQEPERQILLDLALVRVKLGGSRFGSSRLGDSALQEASVHSLVYVLDPFVKIR